MDHIYPYVGAPFSELSCQEYGVCSKVYRVERVKHLDTYVRLNLVVHAIEVAPGLTESLAYAIGNFSRYNDLFGRVVDTESLTVW